MNVPLESPDATVPIKFLLEESYCPDDWPCTFSQSSVAENFEKICNKMNPEIENRNFSGLNFSGRVPYFILKNFGNKMESPR